MTKISELIYRSTYFIITALLVQLIIACQQPREQAKKNAEEAELKSKTAETVEDWRAIDELWRQAIITLEDEEYSEETLNLLSHYAQGRLDALLKIELLQNEDVPCDTKIPQVGRQEPQYWGRVGYVTVHKWSNLDLYEKVKKAVIDKKFDPKDWQISAVKTSKNSPDKKINIGSKVQVIKTSLKHITHASYEGLILVQDIESKEDFWINTVNFSLADPAECLTSED